MSRPLTLKLCIVLVLLCVSSMTGARDVQRVFYSFDASNGMADNSAQTIKCTKTGRMVISTIGHVNFYDGDAFSHIDPQLQDIFPLPKYNGHYHMYFDRFHHLWLKDKQSVTCVNLLTERFISNVDSVIRQMGMTKPVDDMFGDHQNHIWFMSGNRLYSMEHGMSVPIGRKAELQDVDVYNDSLMLQFFSDGFVFAYDLKHDRHAFDSQAFKDGGKQRYDKSSVLYPSGDVYYQIRNGDTAGVLLRFDVPTRQWQQLMSTDYHLNNMDMHKGRLYIASEYGYWIYDLATGTSRHMETLQLTRGRKLSTDINTICFDRQGGLWIGTERRGLLYSKPFKSPFESYSWDEPEAKYYGDMLYHHAEANKVTLPRHVNCQFRDSRGWLWTGKYTGLEMQKTPDGPTRVYGRKDGLLNEMIHSIVEDDSHDIWVGTSYGITHLFIRADSIVQTETHTGYDNVPNESFANGLAMKLSDGTILMQTLDHVVKFHPDQFSRDSVNSMRLLPKLIKLIVNGQVVKAGMEVDGKVILEKAVTRTGEVHVDYNQNTLSLTFSGLNFFRPVQTYYRVRVKGVPAYNDWRVLSYNNSGGLVDGRGLLHLPLVGLLPGKYYIELQASTTPDHWMQEPYVWVVNVKQPWWRSTGIYILLIFLLLAVALTNFYLYNRNLRLRMQRNNEELEVVKRVVNFAERCDSLTGEVLSHYTAAAANQTEASVRQQQEFVDAMLTIVPYINSHRGQRFNMQQLAALVGRDPLQLYTLLAANLYQSPRQLAGLLHLQEAAELLRTTDLSVDDIADRCRFVSPNFFIACFYHQYRQTPKDYRNSTPR